MNRKREGSISMINRLGLSVGFSEAVFVQYSVYSADKWKTPGLQTGEAYWVTSVQGRGWTSNGKLILVSYVLRIT